MTWLVPAAVGFYQIFVAIRFWNITWDDSAITLGFARAFSISGVIEPTVGSGRVEGFSTLSWMLIMALFAKVASPHGLYVIAKVLTLCLNLINLALIRQALRGLTGVVIADLAAGVAGALAMYYETINGMETPLLLLLVLVMAIFYARRDTPAQIVVLVAGSVLVITRFEALWWTLPFLLVRRERSVLLLRGATWGGVFAAVSLWRHAYFSIWVPNTVLAKRSEPYSSANSHLEAIRHITGLKYPFFELLGLAAILLLTSGILLHLSGAIRTLRQGQPAGRPLPDGVRFCAWMTLAGLVLCLGIGQNWGPPEREFLPAWPFAIALLLYTFAWLVDRAKGTGFSPPSLPSLSVWSIALVTLLLMVRSERELAVPNPPRYMPGVTVDRVATILPALNQVKDAIGGHDIVFAGPDMGGIMLYGKGIRLVDLGLLCDPVLSRLRYTAGDTYVLQQRHPDVIEVHGNWAHSYGYEHDPLLAANYTIVVTGPFRFLVRNDQFAAIPRQRLVRGQLTADGRIVSLESPGKNDYLNFTSRVDYQLNREFGVYYTLLPANSAAAPEGS